MYLISNRERRDIMRLLAAYKTILANTRTPREANMARIAGLLVRSLENKKETIQSTKQ